jgi:hypothetical protein
MEGRGCYAMRQLKMLLIVVSAALLTAPIALAQQPSSGAGEGGGVQGTVGGGGTNASGSLPFTGLDLVVLSGGAVLLLALGLGLRAVTQRQ